MLMELKKVSLLVISKIEYSWLYLNFYGKQLILVFGTQKKVQKKSWLKFYKYAKKDKISTMRKHVSKVKKILSWLTAKFNV